ncbi:hypothetical protein SDC9_181181 [bioreactor metagenome]|uniref:Large polyvalent protein associated domain-containing protein n=1 Tax=bioreactor metagenome TaxID=1076179 RepID=A0A645H4S6_9ZZZZ|nr:LPD28 domain-containing protein [Lachnospiraceae bacterium]
MAAFDAKKEGYELGEIDGKLVAFTNMRLNRQTIPESLYCYDIRDSDNLDGSCAELKTHVMVNHWGTVLCKKPFELDKSGSYYPENNMDYLGVSLSLDEFQESSEEELRESVSIKNRTSMSGIS